MSLNCRVSQSSDNTGNEESERVQRRENSEVGQGTQPSLYAEDSATNLIPREFIGSVHSIDLSASDTGDSVNPLFRGQEVGRFEVFDEQEVSADSYDDSLVLEDSGEFRWLAFKNIEIDLDSPSFPQPRRSIGNLCILQLLRAC